MVKPCKPKKSADGHKIHPTKKVKRTGGGRHKDGNKKTFLNKKKIKKTFKTADVSKENNPKVHENKVDSSKELKRKLTPKERKDAKKEKKDQFEVVTKFMTIYEALRRKSTSLEERKKLIEQVLEISIDKESEVCYKHDTVRVLEMCVKYGTDQQKDKLFELFKKNTLHLVQSKYAKFLVEKFIEYGSKDQKRKIVESFYGNVKKLIKHKGASIILDEIYDKYATSAQRTTLVEEFYGPEFAIFKVATGRTLEDILNHEPKKKVAIMKYMKESFITLCQKELVIHSIVHRALFDFFKFADLTQKMEIIEVLKEAVVYILHTKDGAKVAMNCLWFGTAKDRKTIIKSFKTFVGKICKEEYGHLVMLALFDVIDDTVLVKKALFPEILSNLEELMLDQYGRKVILYLLKPRSKSYFIPDIIKLLEQGDSNVRSKKKSSVRQQELRDAILPDLLDAMALHTKDILRNKSASIVLLAALEIAADTPQAINLMKEIASLVGKPFKKYTDDEDATEPIVCDPCGHWVVKSLIQQDKKRLEEGDTLFSKLLCHSVPDGCFSDWSSSNRGAFVLVSLLESGVNSVKERVKEDLKFMSTNTHTDSKGFEILKKLLLM